MLQKRFQGFFHLQIRARKRAEMRQNLWENKPKKEHVVCRGELRSISKWHQWKQNYR